MSVTNKKCGRNSVKCAGNDNFFCIVVAIVLQLAIIASAPVASGLANSVSG